MLIGALLGMVQLLTLDHARDEVSPGSEHYAFELSEDAKESTFGSQLIATISSGPQAGKRVMLFTNEKVESIAEMFLKLIACSVLLRKNTLPIMIKRTSRSQEM